MAKQKVPNKKTAAMRLCGPEAHGLGSRDQQVQRRSAVLSSIELLNLDGDSQPPAAVTLDSAYLPSIESATSN